MGLSSENQRAIGRGLNSQQFDAVPVVMRHRAELRINRDSYQCRRLSFAKTLSEKGGSASRFAAIDLRSSAPHASRYARCSERVHFRDYRPLIFRKLVLVRTPDQIGKPHGLFIGRGLPGGQMIRIAATSR